MTLVLGALRAREMFPKSSRFDTKALLDWETRTKATLLAPEAFDLIYDPALAELMPYAVLPVQLFGRPLRSVISEMQRRLGLIEDGFGLVWIGSGGHVTPLHHDGPMVHGRWHLVVHGRKRFDFLPPNYWAFPGWRRGTSTGASARCTSRHFPTLGLRTTQAHASNCCRGRW
jgi:hypothetical protein